MNDERTPVSVIGLGPMGQAMVRTLLAAGHPVTVWNRTASRADDLVAEGATRADTPGDALAASDVALLSLTDYQAMYDIFDATPASAFAGRVLVNLSSDTPDRTRDASAWALERGAQFLAGGVMAPAPAVGTDDAYVYYSGPKEVVAAHERMLSLIGSPRYVGEDPGLAQLFYQAQLDVFLTVLSGVLHATALVASAGVPASEFLPDALQTVLETPAMIGDVQALARQLDTGVHPGDLSTATMMGATADHIVGASKAAGIDLELPLAVKSHYDRALAAGHGQDDWTSLFEVIKRPPAASASSTV